MKKKITKPHKRHFIFLQWVFLTYLLGALDAYSLKMECILHGEVENRHLSYLVKCNIDEAIDITSAISSFDLDKKLININDSAKGTIKTYAAEIIELQNSNDYCDFNVEGKLTLNAVNGVTLNGRILGGWDCTLFINGYVKFAGKKEFNGNIALGNNSTLELSHPGIAKFATLYASSNTAVICSGDTHFDKVVLGGFPKEIISGSDEQADANSDVCDLSNYNATMLRMFNDNEHTDQISSVCESNGIRATLTLVDFLKGSPPETDKKRNEIVPLAKGEYTGVDNILLEKCYTHMINILRTFTTHVPNAKDIIIESTENPRFRSLFFSKKSYFMAMIAFLNTCHQGVSSDVIEETKGLRQNGSVENGAKEIAQGAGDEVSANGIMMDVDETGSKKVLSYIVEGVNEERPFVASDERKSPNAQLLSEEFFVSAEYKPPMVQLVPEPIASELMQDHSNKFVQSSDVIAEEKPLTALEIRRIKYKEFMKNAEEKRLIEEEEREVLEKDIRADDFELRQNKILVGSDQDGPIWGLPASNRFEYSLIEKKIGKGTLNTLVVKRKILENNDN